MLLVYIACSIGIISGAPAGQEGVYTTKYDHLNVDSILNNRRMVNYYAACMLSKGPCTAEGLEFKRILPDALQTNCEKCTEKQKVATLRSVKRLRKEYPKVWAQLEALWDPNGIYVNKFISTYDKRSQGVPASSTSVIPTTATNTVPQTSTSKVPAIFNRFGDDDKRSPEKTTPKKLFSTTPKPFTSNPVTTTSTTIKPIVPVITTSKPSSSSFKPFVTTSTTSNPSTTTPKAAVPSTTKPRTSTSTNIINNFGPTTQQRPTVVVGTNLQATVSYGTNLVGGIVRRIGDLGIRVIDSGVQLTERVLQGVQNVVTPKRY